MTAGAAGGTEAAPPPRIGSAMGELAGALNEQLETAIAALPKVVYDPAHTAGLDAAIYQQELAALKEAAEIK